MKISVFEKELLLASCSNYGAVVCSNSYVNLQQIGFPYRPIQFPNIGREIEMMINRCQS